MLTTTTGAKPVFELKTFQEEAANLISDRYTFFANHPERPMRGNTRRPFFQALSALTGAGKTPILAHSISLIRNHLSSEPIVLWMSKARTVVTQTYNNFNGGKYAELIEGFRVVQIKEVTPQLISDSNVPLIIMTTTGLFNNKDGETGALNIYKKAGDSQGDKSVWERIIERSDGTLRRPLIVVYDEGHNLSEQQTVILSELEPEAYLLASATLRLPDMMNRSVVQPMKLWLEECSEIDTLVDLKCIDENEAKKTEMFITTSVNSNLVVGAQLVKKAIQFDGTTAPMERSLDDLTDRLSIIEKEAKTYGIKPKAIYVCRTNINDDGAQDDPSLPFNMRNSPPIKIWKYLVESKGVDPNNICIYADLKFRNGTKPDQVHLFSKGEDDFDTFLDGDFQHIIFNLSLQEGWDDPSCYLAYIDKSMGSNLQVEQVIGRVLRQPAAVHYDSALLNSAHFFVRVDNQSVFSDTIKNIRDKLQREGSPIQLTESFSPNGGSNIEEILPREDFDFLIHEIFIDKKLAQASIQNSILNRFPLFREDDALSQGEADVANQTIDILDGTASIPVINWTKSGNSNSVRVRWLLNNAIRRHTAQALKIVDFTAPKYDSKVQIRSFAEDHIIRTAKDIVDAYYNLSDLCYESAIPYEFGTLRVIKSKSYSFTNSLYPKYSDFNEPELIFARGLDSSGHKWHRNPSNGGYKIPLPTEGDTDHFLPDFIALKDGMVYCIDTKGKHLLTDAITRKLFDIKDGATTKLLVRFVVEGKQETLGGKSLKGGYTVWKLRAGAITPILVETVEEAVVQCLM